MNLMFYKCSSLYSLPDISKWNTYNIINIGEMFSGASSLSYLPSISNWEFNSYYEKTIYLMNAFQFYICPI